MDDTGTAAVLLFDNHCITKTALRDALVAADGLRICAEAGDFDEVAVVLSGAPAPDVVVFTEANDPTIVLSRITDAAPEWPVKAVMVGGDGIPSELALRCASVGSLPWTASEQEFVSAVRLVAAGHSVISRHRGDDGGPRRVRADHARVRRAAAGGQGLHERGDLGRAGARREHGEVARAERAEQAGRAQPRERGDLRLRGWPDAAERIGALLRLTVLPDRPA